MSSISGWYDPVCYQFFFYAVSDKNAEPSIVKACEEFMDELKPFYSLWISKGGSLLSKSKILADNGYHMKEISSTEEFGIYRNAVSSSHLRYLELSPVPGKTLAKFAASGRSIAKATKDKVAQFTDRHKLKEVDKTAQKEWLFDLINCPTDDLRGLYFPKKCFISGEMFLRLTYESWCTSGTAAYIDDILGDVDRSPSDMDDAELYYLHRVYVSIPRFMLDAMDQPFLLQSAWKKRLSTLCESFEHSTGYMKMDVCESRHGSSLLTGGGRFFPGFTNYLPDIAWGMCLTDKQVQALGGMEYLKDAGIFHDIEILSNKKFFLQHTPDISIVTKNEAEKLCFLASPHMNVSPHFSHSIIETPVSFRMGIDYDRVQINDYGYYTIQMNQETVP